MSEFDEKGMCNFKVPMQSSETVRRLKSQPRIPSKALLDRDHIWFHRLMKSFISGKCVTILKTNTDYTTKHKKLTYHCLLMSSFESIIRTIQTRAMDPKKAWKVEINNSDILMMKSKSSANTILSITLSTEKVMIISILVQ